MKVSGKLGLVLSGGGAKGAYQVGIIKYMSEIGMQPDMVSGTSIGALNASVICASRDIEVAATALDEIWKELANTSPIQIGGKNNISSVGLLMNFIPGAKLNPIINAVDILRKGADFAKDAYAKYSDEYKNSSSYKSSLERRDQGILNSEPLVDLLNNYAPTEKLKTGLPFYISVYESRGSSRDLVDYMNQSLLGNETRNSEFWHVQSLEEETMQDAIMASAALPLLFQARAINGTSYRDGGMGGAFNQQGNTPVQPLVDNGCSHVVVSLLEDGSSFNRHNFPSASIIEVRPKEFISDSALDMIAFNPDKINYWMEQGYLDAKRCIGNVKTAMEGLSFNKETAKERDSVINQLESDGFNITS